MHPFDLQHTLLAKHAQHIVLVHFPIALVMVALGFDLLAMVRGRQQWSTFAYYNLSIAALAALPVVVTGLIAWRWQLEGAPLKGVLRMHLVLGLTSCAMIWVSWWIARRERRGTSSARMRIVVETVAVLAVAITAHLGGIVSGVNA